MPKKRDASSRDDYSYERYDEPEGAGASNSMLPSFLAGNGKLIVALVVIIVILAVVGLLLFRGAHSPTPLTDANGNEIQFHGKVDINGNLVREFLSSADANKYTATVNPNEKSTVTLNTRGFLTPGNKRISATITRGGQLTGKSVRLSDGAVVFDENGQLVITIDPEIDLVIKELYPNGVPDGTTLDFNLHIVIFDENTGETTTITVPITYTFSEYMLMAGNCLAVNRTAVSDFTHKGTLEVEMKVKLLCPMSDDLGSFVEWKSQRMGNVEIRKINDPYNGTTLQSSPLPILSKPAVGEYTLKVTFVPFAEFAGKIAQFSLGFGYAATTAKVNFDVALDNLEQCVKVSSQKSIISGTQGTADITVDASSCKSQKVNIYLCYNDSGCSGGAPEGYLTMNNAYYSLSPLSGGKRTTVISRGDLAGSYGVIVSASIPGTSPVEIDEKEITVMPTDETIYPEKFSVSMIGDSAKDSVRVYNKNLAEDVTFSTSVCSLFNNSLGSLATSTNINNMATASNSFSQDWWYDLATNPTLYSGDGKYQAAFIGSMNEIRNAFFAVQTISTQKNGLVKDAYTLGQNAVSDTASLTTYTTAAYDKAVLLKDKTSNINNFKDTDIAAQTASLVSTATAITTNSLWSCSKISAAVTAATTTSSALTGFGCTTAPETVTGDITTYLTAAHTEICGATTANAVELASGISSLYSLYQQVDALTIKNKTIDSTTAVDDAKKALDKLQEATKIANGIADNLDLALEAASIDSYLTASDSDKIAADYLQKARDEHTKLVALLAEVRTYGVLADDSVTTLAADQPTQTTLVTQITQLLVSISALLITTEAEVATAQTALTTAQKGIVTATSACSTDYTTTCNYKCCLPAASGKSLGSLSETIGLAQTSLASYSASLNTALEVTGLLNTAYGTWRSTMNNYADELTNSRTAYSDLITSLDNTTADMDAATTAYDPAIAAASYLSVAESKSSQASDYATDVAGLAEPFNKERMNGLVSAIIMNGFVNGAYMGGVYTTANTGTQFASVSGATPSAVAPKPKTTSAHLSSSGANLLEDCANKVTLTLPAYVTNLLYDAKPVVISDPSVGANWSFGDSKVFDMYNTQEAGLVFFKNGLSKNTYGVVELSADEHVHAQNSEQVGAFGPFNLLDSTKNTKTYKYHFRFNAATRKASVPATSPTCVMGLYQGNTGKDALPKVIVGWDWNNVNPSTYKENYLDATQLSILLSKKLSGLNDFLNRTSLSCPENMAYKVLQAITPTEVQLSAPACFLPRTTRAYDGKPALYYFITSTVSSSGGRNAPNSIIANSAQDFLDLVDFNANLMRDGYGKEFQFDFVDAYQGAIFKATTEFTDPLTGSYRFFSDNARAYFSSDAQYSKSSNDFALPDAGQYKVRILADFDDNSVSNLISNGQVMAKMVYSLDLTQPINSEYSPLYYLPIDGSVGAMVSNDRRFYGTSVSAGDAFSIGSNDAVQIDNAQKDSLVKIYQDKLERFSLLNAYNSMRGKLLTIFYEYDGKSDDNAGIVFSPSIATPILLKTTGTAKTSPYFLYKLQEGTQDVAVKTNNLFLVSGVNGCNDFSGNKSTDTFLYSPDFKSNNFFGVQYPPANVSGTTYLKTVVYAPTVSTYGIAYSNSGEILTANDNSTNNGATSLEGIKGMPYNDLASNSRIASMANVFDAVRNNSACVTRFGNEEIYWWPESYLYDTKSSDGQSLTDKEKIAVQTCIK